MLSTPLSRGGKSDVSVCPKVLNEQFGQRDIGVTVLSVTCATERALNGAAVVLFPLFTELGQRNRSKLSEFMDRLPLQWLAILSGSTGTGMVKEGDISSAHVLARAQTPFQGFACSEHCTRLPSTPQSPPNLDSVKLSGNLCSQLSDGQLRNGLQEHKLSGVHPRTDLG